MLWFSVALGDKDFIVKNTSSIFPEKKSSNQEVICLL